MEKVELGCIVEWKSQAGGVAKKKRGEVVVVVAPGWKINSDTWAGLDVSIEFDLPCNERPTESYLVRVENVRKGRAALYWPPSGKLTVLSRPPRPADVERGPDHETTPRQARSSASLLPGIPERGPLAIAAENYLIQASRVKDEKQKLSIMGQGVMQAMQTEKRLKLTLEQEGEAWRFEVQPTGYHLRVVRSKE